MVIVMYIRAEYLEQLIKLKDLNLVKVITGVRRCGKSTLLMQFRDYLIDSNINKENIIYMNFESSEWFEITNYKDLTKYIHGKKQLGKLYILLDEIQNVEKWEKAVNSFLVDLDCDIYITGSNAYLLSSELTTLLAGRIMTIKLYPLSFKEYLDNNKSGDIESNFLKYLKYGGMPMLLSFNNEDNIKNYLSDIKDVVLKKDVISRNQIKDVALLDNLLRYLASTSGNLISASSIADFLSRNGRKIHNETIDNYLQMLINAFIIYKIPRFMLDGKELLKTQGKYYFVDTGIRNIINGLEKYTSGSSLENIIYLELLRNNYQVYVGKHNDLEVDFVAIKNGDVKYYQVCRSLGDEDVLKRETRSLLAIKDNCPKVILTFDKVEHSNIDGIEIINIIDFLVNKSSN